MTKICTSIATGFRAALTAGRLVGAVTLTACNSSPTASISSVQPTAVGSSTGFMAPPVASAPWGHLRDVVGHKGPTVVVTALIRESVVPEQDRTVAVLVWITRVDERIVIDLARTHGWTVRRISVT